MCYGEEEKRLLSRGMCGAIASRSVWGLDTNCFLLPVSGGGSTHSAVCKQQWDDSCLGETFIFYNLTVCLRERYSAISHTKCLVRLDLILQPCTFHTAVVEKGIFNQRTERLPRKMASLENTLACWSAQFWRSEIHEALLTK